MTKPLHKTNKLAFAAALSALAGSPAFALTDQEMLALIKAQSEQIQHLQARLERLEVGSATPSQALMSTAVKPGGSAQAETTIKWNAVPELSVTDGGFSFKPKGKIQVDTWASHSGESANYGSGTELRRARLGFQGRIYDDFSYVAEFEFAGKKVGFEDIYIQYNGFDRWSLRLGHHEAPVSLEDEISDTNLPFLERSVYNQFTLGRSVGIALATSGDNWSFKTGVFGEPEVSSSSTGIDEGWRTSARITYLPWQKGDSLVHLGASSYYVQLASDTPEFRLKASPDSHPLADLIDTGPQPSDSLSFFGLEFAGAHGPLSFQGEWGLQHVDYQAVAAADFTGGYTQVAWLVTGESRPYSVSDGKFGAISPSSPLQGGGYGALELALRYSHMDWNDAVIEGGVQDTWTLGVNWYINTHMRLMANLVHFDVRDSGATLPLGSADHQGDLLGVRAQLVW